ncbi:MAG: glycosyltransferase [Acidimicrobiales bacterium]
MVLSQDLDLGPYRQAIACGQRPRHVLLDLAERTGGVALSASGARPSVLDKLGGRLVGRAESWWTAREALRRSRGGYVHANNEILGYILLLLLGLRRGPSARVGFWVMTPDGRQSRIWLRLVRLLRLRPVLLAESGRKAAAIRRIAGPSAQVIMPGEPIDLEFFQPGPRAGVPATLAESVRRPLVVSAGLERRDYRTLAAALDGLEVDVRICAMSPNARATSAVLPGEIPVWMHFDELDTAGLRDLYQAADVVVVPTVPNSIDAGYSVVMEAMACGRPVVATAHGQFIDLAGAGLLRVAAPGDPEDLRRVVIELLDDREAALTLGKVARADLEANHTDTGWMGAVVAAARRGGVTVNEPADSTV